MRQVGKLVGVVCLTAGLLACTTTGDKAPATRGSDDTVSASDIARAVQNLGGSVFDNPGTTVRAAAYFAVEPLYKRLIATTRATEETVFRYGVALATIAEAFEIKHQKLNENLAALAELRRAEGNLTAGLEAATEVAESSSDLSSELAEAVEKRFDTLDPDVQRKVIIASEQLVVGNRIQVFAVAGMTSVVNDLTSPDLANELAPAYQQGLLVESVEAFVKLPRTFLDVLNNLVKPVKAKERIVEVTDISEQLEDRSALLDTQADTRLAAIETVQPEQYQMRDDDPALVLLGLSSSKAEAVELLNPFTDREDARTVQSALKERGFYRGAIDGDFGPGSKRALNAFKVSKRLEPDSQWTEETQSLLLGK